jgi:5'-3' exonuclease
LPVSIVVAENIEADDAISYYCTSVFKNDVKIVMSADKDFLQLVDEKTKVWSPTKKILYDQQKIKEEFGFISKNFIIFKILTGDNSDNIPGIKGLGLKTIKKQFPFLFEDNKVTLQEVFNFSEKYSSLAKPIKNVFQSRDQLELNYKLMQLSDVSISEHMKIILTNEIKQPPNRLNKFNITKLVLEDGLNTQIKNFEDWMNDCWRMLEIYNLKKVNE